MEEKKLSEKESLELISQMIQNTKTKMGNGTGNIMLLWGYLTIVVSIAVYLCLIATRNGQWNLLWFAIPVVDYPLMLLIDRKGKHKEKYCRTHIDSTISTIWTIMGICMLVATLFYCWKNYSAVLMPIALILIGIGSIFTFAILKMKSMTCFCAIGLVLGMWILGDFLQDGDLYINSILIFAIGFVCVMIIPGHYLNYKARKQC